MVLADPTEEEPPIHGLDVIVHPPHLLRQHPVVVPELQRLDVRELEEFDEVSGRLGADEEGGIPREDGKVVASVTQGVFEDIGTGLLTELPLLPEEEGDGVDRLGGPVGDEDGVILK
jgi:hypothetical protein